MHRVTLLAIGSPKHSWVQAAGEQFTDRLRGDLKLEVVELPASKQTDPQKQSAAESQSVLDRLESVDGVVWVLDERGRELTSAEFSQAVGDYRDQGQPITFVLGGAYGLNDAVRERADRLLALSQMTLPHDLARVVFLEQLYRAVQIEKGSGYHH